MGNKRKRRSRRVESQSSDRDEITSKTSFTHGNATLVDVSEKVDYIFDSELAEPSQTSNEMEGFSQILAERKSTEMSQIEEQLNS